MLLITFNTPIISAYKATQCNITSAYFQPHTRLEIVVLSERKNGDNVFMDDKWSHIASETCDIRFRGRDG